MRIDGDVAARIVVRILIVALLDLPSALIAVLAPTGAAAAAEQRVLDASPAPQTFAEVARMARPAVVTLRLPGEAAAPRGTLAIEDEDDEGLEAEEEPETTGLEWRTLGVAVIVDPAGLAVTTASLGRLAPALEAVLPDGRELEAVVVGIDEPTDLAVLRMHDRGRPFARLALGNSDRVRAGDGVVAVGAPFGLESSVTAGIVSSTPPEAETATLGVFIQTDASLDRGYRGGPLVNTAGQIVGVIVGGGDGTGFAVPSNAVKRVFTALVERGRVPRGWLGVTGQPLTSDLARVLGTDIQSGVLVTDVTPDGPAALALIRPGDVIRVVDGKRTEGPMELARVLDRTAPEQTITLTLRQRTRDVTAAVTLGTEPDIRDPRSVWARARQLTGAEIRAITSDLGVTLDYVAALGPAGRAGLRRGDIIRELNRQWIRSMTDFERALRGVKPGGEIVVLVQRGRASLYVTFTTAPD